MNPTKTALRKQLKQARLALSPQERQTKSTAIAEQLWQVTDWSKIKTLHCYEPIERLGEVDISDFIASLQAEYPQIQIFTSRLVDNCWQAVSISAGVSIPDAHFDVIIVPMLGFNNTLHRIGYGGGYYDQFLAAQPSAKKIGVCFDIGHLDHFPVETNDIALDVIITDSEIYSS